MNGPRLKHHKQRIALVTVHTKRTRVSEAAELGVADTGSRQMTILVARGKGQKQRLVPLSRPLLVELRAWWAVDRNRQWVLTTIHRPHRGDCLGLNIRCD